MEPTSKSDRPALEIIELLTCDIEVRPRNAPSFDDLAPHIIAIARDSNALTIDYAPDASDDMQRLVAAERLCCSTIGWHLDTDACRLRITATPAQLDAIEQLLAKPA